MSQCDVLMGIYEFATGGAEVLARKLATHVRDRGMSVTVMATHGEKGPVSDMLEAEGIACVTARSHALNSIARRWRLYQIFRQYKPRLFHAHHTALFQYCYWPARLACKPRTIMTEHTDFEFLNVDVYREAAKFCASHADIITAVHHGMAESFKDVTSVDPEKLVVIENGVDTNQFRPDVPGVHIREQLGVTSDDVLVGFVGRLHEQKNVPALLAAIPSVIQSAPNAQFAIIGDGPDEASLREQATSLGIDDRVTFTGRINDIPATLPGIDVFVLPSMTEGLPLALLEAMSSGVASVATRVGANASILSEDAGILVTPGDSKELGTAISSLVNDREKRQQMGKRAREIVEQRYVEQECFEKYERLFSDQLASG